LCHPKNARHTRIPPAMATINPKTPPIMSQSELLILLQASALPFKDAFQIQYRA
jgi:hypothetical protein